MRNRDRRSLRVAFFPDAYNEVDGVANTSRHFEAFARNRELPFLTIHAGPRNEIVTAGSVIRVQLRAESADVPARPDSRIRPCLVVALSRSDTLGAGLRS